MNVKHYLDITKLYSNEGTPLVCRYLEMVEFEVGNPLCQTLHFCFCIYAQNKGYSSGSNARTAVEEFLKFRVWFNNNNPEKLQLNNLSDISMETFKVYIDYLQKRKIKIKAIQSLRNMFHDIPRTIEDFPKILFPKLPRAKNSPNEPLDNNAIDQLDIALKTHIDKLYEKLLYRQEVDEASPYTYEEVLETCFPSGTKKNVYEWYRYALNNYSSPKTITITGRLGKLNNLDPDFQRCLNEKEPKVAFEKLYKSEATNYLGEESYNSFEYVGIRRWKPDYKRVLKTFHVHGYPFILPIQGTRRYNDENTQNLEKCTDVIALIYHRLTRARAIHKRLEKTGIPVLGLDEVINYYYPNQMDMAAIMLMLQFQAGWNKETVIALDQDNFEHSLSGMIDETQRLISSEKKRGQNNHLPFSKPKTMLAVSDIKDKYSIYRVIELAKSLSKPFTEFELEEVEAFNKKINMLFACTTDHGDWHKKSRFSTMGNIKTSTRGVREFLKTYEIINKGERLTTSSQIVGSIRLTWIYLKRKTEPLSLVQSAAGHANSKTTDIHYDSSVQSAKHRTDRLRSELNEICSKLKAREFEGLLPNENSKQVGHDNIVIFSIPGHGRELWGCNDQFSPTWDDHPTYVKRGDKCFYLNKCYSCKQLRLFNDSLPYILERFEYIEQCSLNMPVIEFSQLFGGEYNALKWVIDNWNDKESLKLANRYLKQKRPLLPKDLASLTPLMKTLYESTNDISFWKTEK